MFIIVIIVGVVVAIGVAMTIVIIGVFVVVIISYFLARKRRALIGIVQIASSPASRQWQRPWHCCCGGGIGHWASGSGQGDPPQGFRHYTSEIDR